MKTSIITYTIGFIAFLTVTSCKKYLEVKSDTALSTIKTVNDAQLILDNAVQINIISVPYYSELSSDNYYYTESFFDGQIFNNSSNGNLYIWGKYPFISNTGISYAFSQWSQVYAGIMIANSALDGIKDIKIDNSNSENYNNVKGSALAYRGYYFWKLAATFAKAYNDQTANTDLGIPLRLNININEKSTRGNVQQTYDQIIKDLTTAASLLPVKGAYVTRPSKISTYAMLAEVYLSMRKYEKAYAYADSSLLLKHDLIDYNTLNTSSSSPIPVFRDNIEILSFFSAPLNMQSSGMLIDTTLYNLYINSDLRKRFFFGTNADNTHYFSGTYGNQGYPFTGPTSAEMYLTRAECLARQGKTVEAMQDLNKLIVNRVSANSYVPYSASSADQALQMILEERRKELVFRDLRWIDIKRLNLEGANITLTRKLGDKTYILPPNDNRFAIQIPPEVVQLSGVEQNPY